jgi:hypothetical protein
MKNPKATLTEQEIAALASGAAIVAAAQTPEQLAAAEAAAAAEAQAAAEAATAAAAAEAQAAAEAATAAAAAEAAASADKGVVAFLQAQIKEKDEQLIAAGVTRKELEAKVTSIEATHQGLLTIARESIGKMQVALGGSAADLSSVEPVAVLAEHSRVSAEFKKQFKVGGVAVTAPEEKSETTPAAGKPTERQARLKAVRIGK